MCDLSTKSVAKIKMAEAHDFEISFSNIVALDLPDNQLGSKRLWTPQSPFVSIDIGNTSVVSTTQKSAGTDVMWDKDVLHLRIDEKRWGDPEAIVTMSVRNDRQPSKPNAIACFLFLCPNCCVIHS